MYTDNDDFSRLSKWRLMLGPSADPQGNCELSGDMTAIDAALQSLYDDDDDTRKGGLGSSSPKLNRWLGDIRQYFPSSVVQVMIKDAIEQHNLQQLLFEKEVLENIEPDIHMVGTLLSLSKMMPEQTKTTARTIVRKVVDDLEKKLTNPLREAINGAMARSVRNRRPKIMEIDWKRTIRDNMKHYQADYKTIIPQNLIGFGRKGQALREIVLCVDQSGSMASSVVYSAVFGAVLASLKAVKTQMVVFDTAVVDLTKDLQDPVDLLFATQLGGGTDINKAVGYCQTLITRPQDTIFVLITDLYEGGNEREFVRRAAEMKASGINFITLLTLSDDGKPAYDHNLAQKLASLDIPSFACTPDAFPSLMAAAIKKENLAQWQARELGTN